MQHRLLLKHHVRFLVWPGDDGFGHYGLKPYIPALGALRQMPKDDETAKATAWVYGFKRHFKNAGDVRLIVEAAATHFGCDGIIPIPPSHPDRQPNSLQKLFGKPIVRIREAETRKYRHRQPIPPDHCETYRLKLPRGKRFLLVDDILRTGRTMDHFRAVLEKSGFEAVSVALGMYYRLPFLPGDSISIYETRSETDMELERLMMEI